MDNYTWEAQYNPENTGKQINVKTQLCKKPVYSTANEKQP